MATDNQQMLMLVVRNRYGERSSLLAVSSITANVSVKTSAGVQLGFGNSDDYAGSLVPFGAGVIHEENPTISYSPVGGSNYFTRLMSPVPLSAVVQLANNLASPEPSFKILVASINGIHSADFQHAEFEPDARFDRLVEILSLLTRAHRIQWVQDMQQDPQHFSLVLDHYWPKYSDEVNALTTLLGFSNMQAKAARIELPVFLAAENREDTAIHITTRSIYDLLEILSAAVDVSNQDQDDGTAIAYPPLGMVGKRLRIQRSATKPANASVAVQYRDSWFYIADNDQYTKLYFRVLTNMLSIAITDNAGDAAPVLTVPVSR